MSAILKYRGRWISDAEIFFIRDLIAENPSANRRALSHKIWACPLIG